MRWLRISRRESTVEIGSVQLRANIQILPLDHFPGVYVQNLFALVTQLPLVPRPYFMSFLGVR